MFVGDEITLGAAYPDARSGLLRLTHGGWLSDASGDAYAEGLTGLVRVGPFGPALGASKLVRVLLLEPVEREGSLTLSLRWEAAGIMGRLFPVLDANVTLIPAGENASQLALAGAYRPPFAAAGQGLDRVLLHRARRPPCARCCGAWPRRSRPAEQPPTPARPKTGPLGRDRDRAGGRRGRAGRAGPAAAGRRAGSSCLTGPVTWAGVREPAEELAGHPDRLRWNARYAQGPGASFTPHPLGAAALSGSPPAGPVADLACGPSGAALLAAAAGRRVTAVDISDVALGLLGEESRRRGVRNQITLMQADLRDWHPAAASYALVLYTGYWDRAVFATAVTAVAPGGLLAWEAFTADAQRARPGLCPQWCLADGEQVSLLGAGFEVLDVRDLADGGQGPKRPCSPGAWPPPTAGPDVRHGEGPEALAVTGVSSPSGLRRGVGVLLHLHRVAALGQPRPGVLTAGHNPAGRGHVPAGGRHRRALPGEDAPPSARAALAWR